MTVLELFEGHPERWTKGMAVKREHGQAVSRCLLGAIDFCYPSWVFGLDAYEEKRQAALKAAGLDSEAMLATWNDAPERTFEEVLDVVRRAGI